MTLFLDKVLSVAPSRSRKQSEHQKCQDELVCLFHPHTHMILCFYVHLYFLTLLTIKNLFGILLSKEPFWLGDLCGFCDKFLELLDPVEKLFLFPALGIEIMGAL